ncbi:siderophore-interacting protein [Mesonia sp. MT50]|uniref:Siderophore-interacting protein n=1 Tax=Mesonia profundi TaxID=3070998 RepID=A0ABU1A4R8_9FLAO|nr:siderophore-interacting protein [Mesonia profundi]MDQ7918690.1 siderophore-interacting protein [Mesonia profundi]
MSKPAPQTLQVIYKEQISLHMIRLKLYGKHINENIQWQPGCYVKLVIPNALSSDEKPKLRTYTAKSYNPNEKVFTIDFAIHQPAGPATDWAINASVGDEIDLLGPGELKINSAEGDWYVFAADMSALPAAISVMESLSADAKGYALLEIMDEGDKQNISIPKNIEVQWFIHPNPTIKSNQQLDALKIIKHLEGVPNIFVAGELSTIREIKSYLQGEERFNNAITYISSYWKIGLKEEEHKHAKMENP